MHNILVIDGYCKYTYNFARCLITDKNIRIHILAKGKHSHLSHSRWISTITYYDEHTDEKLLSIINQLIEKERINIVFALAEEGIEYLSKYKGRINPLAKTCILPSENSFKIASNKAKLGDFCHERDLNTPKLVYVSSNFNPQGLNWQNTKCIVKPIWRSGGGRGIKICECGRETNCFVGNNRELIEEYIVQEYIEGYDLCCSFFSIEGNIIAHSIQKGFSQGKHPFAPYAGIEFIQDEEAFDLAKRLVKELKWSGIGNIDMRYDRNTNKTFIIEMNCRYWDSLIGSYLGAKVNFPYFHLNYSLGKEIEFKGFKLSTYVSAKKYIPEKINNLFKKKGQRIKFKWSGAYLMLTDPYYYYSKNFIKN